MTDLKVGVIGAGMMGAEIALVFALAGNHVRFHDADPDTLKRARERQQGILDKGVDKGAYRPEQRDAALANLEPVDSLDAFDDRGFVIEAVFEDKGVKGEVFRHLDRVLPDDCLISSNTSTLPIATLAAFVRAERRPLFLGTHFFSPVSRMKLVEVIPAFETDEATVGRVAEICKDAGKVPVRVKDVAGFAVNRLLHAFFIEACRLLEEEVATPEDIDVACKLGLGHPVGPFELMDIVTNNLTLEVQDILHDAYGPRFLPRPLLRAKVEAGHTGRKAGRGWYVHENKG